MSLAETQQLYDLLVKIDSILSGIEVKAVKIEHDMPQTTRALATFQQLERLALRWLVVARKMGLPENIESAVNTVARIIIMIRMFQMSINMMAMATGPVGFGIGMGGFMAAFLAVPSMLEGY